MRRSFFTSPTQFSWADADGAEKNALRAAHVRVAARIFLGNCGAHVAAFFLWQN